MRRGSWQAAIQHDGYFVVRLRLFDVGEGGQNRRVQSGMKASWTAPDVEGMLPGLLVFPEQSVRSIPPGGMNVVHVRPLEPSSWSRVEPGTRLGLCRNWPRELGEAHVIERVGVPYAVVPPRFPASPNGAGAAAVLRRRPSFGERVRAALRRLSRSHGR